MQSHFYSSVFTFNKNGGKYCVIDEEVLVRDISLENRYGLDKNLCDCAFATSQQDFISYYNNGFKNIILSGNPRFYHKGSGFKSKSKVLRILFSSNFALMRPLSGHSLERVILDQALSSKEADSLNLFIKSHSKRESLIRKYLIHISKSISVTYRVHPLECIDQQKCF